MGLSRPPPRYTPSCAQMAAQSLVSRMQAMSWRIDRGHICCWFTHWQVFGSADTLEEGTSATWRPSKEILRKYGGLGLALSDSDRS